MIRKRIMAGMVLGVVLGWAHSEEMLWERLSDPFPSGGASDLLVAPDGTLYASSWTHGVARSADGIDWTACNAGMVSLQVDALGVNASGEPLAGVSGLPAPTPVQAWRFSEGQWRPASGATANLRIRRFALSPFGSVFCVTQWQGDIFRSTDAGDSYVRVAGSQAVSSSLGALFEIVSVQDGSLYAGGEADGLWRSADDGLTWQVVGLTNAEGYSGNLWSIGDTLQGKIIVVGKAKGDVGVFSYDGQSFAPSASGIPPYAKVRSITKRPDGEGSIFCGSAKGVFRSGDGGATWSPFRAGLPMKTDTEYQTVYTLIHDARGHLLARTSDGQLYRTIQPTSSVNRPPEILSAPSADPNPVMLR